MGFGKRQMLMNYRTARVPKGKEAWLKVNANESAFFRTNYSKSLRDALHEPIRTKELKTRDRLGLIRDVFALTENGKMSTIESLSFAKNYIKEDEYVVWATLSGGLSKIHSIFSDESFIEEYERVRIITDGLQ